MLHLRAGAVVIDVGANVGQFAESLLAHQPLAQLHAFEPIPEAFATLRSRLHDFGGIQFNNVALGNTAGDRDLVVRRFDECTSFLELGERLQRGVYGLDLAPDRTVRVTIQRLADYVIESSIAAIDLLKLDVQGYELEVLRGAEEILPRTEWIYTEAQFQELYEGGPMFTDIARFLNAHDFDLVRMTSFRFDDDGNLMECDMVFRRRRSNSTKE